MPTLSELSLEDLQHTIVYRYVAGAGSRPAVVVVRAGEDEAVLKDYSHCDRLFAWLVGPLLVWRETSALARLQGTPGVPRLIRKLGARAFLMEHLRGADKAKKQPQTTQPEFYERLRQLVDRIHARGVAHCDMRRSANILVDPAGQPYLVDFVSCAFLRPWWHPLGWMFPLLCQADRDAIIKLKHRAAPELLSEAERGRLEHGPVGKLARGFGALVRDIFRLLLVRNRPKARRKK
jgi:serine/threonine protein kinase